MQGLPDERGNLLSDAQIREECFRLAFGGVLWRGVPEFLRRGSDVAHLGFWTRGLEYAKSNRKRPIQGQKKPGNDLLSLRTSSAGRILGCLGADLLRIASFPVYLCALEVFSIVGCFAPKAGQSLIVKAERLWKFDGLLEKVRVREKDDRAAPSGNLSNHYLVPLFMGVLSSESRQPNQADPQLGGEGQQTTRPGPDASEPEINRDVSYLSRHLRFFERESIQKKGITREIFAGFKEQVRPTITHRAPIYRFYLKPEFTARMVSFREEYPQFSTTRERWDCLQRCFNDLEPKCAAKEYMEEFHRQHDKEGSLFYTETSKLMIMIFLASDVNIEIFEPLLLSEIREGDRQGSPLDMIMTDARIAFESLVELSVNRPQTGRTVVE